MNESTKTSLYQLSLVGLYFPLYYFNTWVGLIYAGVFLFLDLLSWKEALKIHSKDESFKYLVVTIVTTFTAVIFFFANIYELIGTVVNTNTKEAIIGLWEHIYFSVVTFTTLGYGEYTPQGYAKIAASVQALIGLGYFAFVVGISSAMFYSKIQKT